MSESRRELTFVVHGFNQGGATPCGRRARGLRTTVGGGVTCKACLKIIAKAQSKARPAW